MIRRPEKPIKALINRATMLESWHDYYKARNRSEAVLEARAHILTLKAKMRALSSSGTHRPGPGPARRDLLTCYGKALGVHGRLLWYLEHQGLTKPCQIW